MRNNVNVCQFPCSTFILFMFSLLALLHTHTHTETDCHGVCLPNWKAHWTMALSCITISLRWTRTGAIGLTTAFLKTLLPRQSNNFAPFLSEAVYWYQFPVVSRCALGYVASIYLRARHDVVMRFLDKIKFFVKRKPPNWYNQRTTAILSRTFAHHTAENTLIHEWKIQTHESSHGHDRQIETENIPEAGWIAQ